MANPNVPSSSEAVINIVLVGRTGNGKSATGNTILGQQLFTSKKQECKMLRAAIPDGPIINLIDTPGLFDSSMSYEHLSKEIINCLTKAREGIHAMLFVLSVKNRISQEEESTLNILQKIFDGGILDYIIVVFTGGDVLEEKKQTLKDYLRESCPEFLTKILRLCGGRKVLFDNMTMDKDKQAEQRNQLLAHVKNVARETGGRPYTDNMHSKIKEDTDRLRQQQREAEASNLGKAELEERMKQLQKTHEDEMSKLGKKVAKNLTMMKVGLAVGVAGIVGRSDMMDEINIPEVMNHITGVMNDVHDAHDAMGVVMEMMAACSIL